MGLPRPCRLIRGFKSVCSLTCKLGVSEATAHDLRHSERKAVGIGERVILRGAIVEAKYLLRHIAVKVERLNRDIGSAQSALQETPKVFDSLSVNLPTDVLFQMVHGLVEILFYPQVVVCRGLIGEDDRTFPYLIRNLVLQCLALDVRHKPWRVLAAIHGPTFPLQER